MDGLNLDSKERKFEIFELSGFALLDPPFAAVNIHFYANHGSIDPGLLSLAEMTVHFGSALFPVNFNIDFLYLVFGSSIRSTRIQL